MPRSYLIFSTCWQK